MKTQQTNIDLEEFLSNFKFSYFETYSFQRGLEYESKIEELEKIQINLEEKLKNKILTDEEYQLLEKVNSQLNHVQFLFDKNGIIHFSAEKIKSISDCDEDSDQIFKTLNIKTEIIPSWMCGPTYRDAIIFYNHRNEVTEVLNICFSCEFMQNKSKHYIDADEKVYFELKNIFKQFGHKIEE